LNDDAMTIKFAVIVIARNKIIIDKQQYIRAKVEKDELKLMALMQR